MNDFDKELEDAIRSDNKWAMPEDENFLTDIYWFIAIVFIATLLWGAEIWLMS